MKKEQFSPSKSMYMQIKESIKQAIQEGVFEKNQKIPSEKELGERFHVSRVTVRQAIREATKEGFLFTVQGKGTFVADREPAKINQPLIELTTFRDTVISKGLNAGTKLIKSNASTADFAMSKVLNLEVGEQIMCLKLLGTADGKPIVLYESYFQERIGYLMLEEAKIKIDKNIAFSTLDLYKTIEGIEPKYIEQTFEAVGANLSVAELLEVDIGTPLVLITSIVYSEEGLPLEHKKAFYLADKYRFHVRRVI